jgi:hypothetical protein
VQYIDPYGTTIFGTTQAGQIGKELGLLIEKMPNSAQQDLLLRAREFAERVARHPHWFLWFSGD